MTIRFCHVVLWGVALFGNALATAQAPVTQSNPKRTAQVTPGEPVEMQLERKKVTLVDGKESHVPADKALPGDILLETVSYKNRSPNIVKSSEITLPVPANTELVAGSIRPPSAKVSIDGIKFADFPIKRKIRQANGVLTEVPISLGDYRYIRWYPGDLEAGKVLLFSARFKVSDDKPVAQAAAAVMPQNKTGTTTK